MAVKVAPPGGPADGALHYRHRLRDHRIRRRAAPGAGGHQRDRGPDDDSAGHALVAVQLRRARHFAGRKPGTAAGPRSDSGSGHGGFMGGAGGLGGRRPGHAFWTSIRRSCAACWITFPISTTGLADPDSISAAAALADVLIGAVLVAGRKAPHLVTRHMVESMKRGAVIIDTAIDQGGCVETSRPTTLAEPTYLYHGVVHYCVPNMTADVSRSASMALAQALLPYLLRISGHGIERALQRFPGTWAGRLYSRRRLRTAQPGRDARDRVAPAARPSPRGAGSMSWMDDYRAKLEPPTRRFPSSGAATASTSTRAAPSRRSWCRPWCAAGPSCATWR